MRTDALKLNLQVKYAKGIAKIDESTTYMKAT